ncbi:hypothetical protein GDO78_000448 [Eleutherodactylus coqui]|uniref:Uncharacterized protein n=1 Tax=Eleutherodactylus coqui TaxID=57060 RepID=A0A8J6KH35_ELECQ|nr:hypothetical protein GDO78_000448 [Eleutherodactylus coqui]
MIGCSGEWVGIIWLSALCPCYEYISATACLRPDPPSLILTALLCLSKAAVSNLLLHSVAAGSAVTPPQTVLTLIIGGPQHFHNGGAECQCSSAARGGESIQWSSGADHWRWPLQSAAVCASLTHCLPFPCSATRSLPLPALLPVPLTAVS